MTAAIVKLASGSTYACERCELDAGAVTFTGRLRVRDLTGERLYPRKTITVPIGRVRRVEWLGDETAQARPGLRAA